MHSPTRIFSAVLLLALYTVLVVFVVFHQRQAAPVPLLGAVVADLDAPAYGGHSWVQWETGPRGLTVREVHPLLRANPLLGDNYLREGDVLRSLDYVPVYGELPALLRAAPPGQVFVYQVERLNRDGFTTQMHTLLIENAFEPAWSFPDSARLWRLFPWLVIPGLLLSLLTLLIVFPTLRRRIREHGPLLLLLPVAFLLFLLLTLRHLNLLTREELVGLYFERAFVMTFSGALLLYALLFLYARLHGRQRLFILPLVAFAVIFAAVLGGQVYGQAFWASRDLLLSEVMGLYLLLCWASLLLALTERWKGRSRIDRLFHLTALVAVSPLLVLNLAPVWGGMYPSAGVVFLSLATLFIPFISSAAAQLKFGRVSLVLTGTLQAILFAVITFVLWLVIQEFSGYLRVNPRYRSYLEIGALIVILLVLRSLYAQYEGRFRQFFILAPQKKRERIEQFIAMIPQHTSTQQLKADLITELRAYFGTETAWLWLQEEHAEDMPGVTDVPVLADTLLAQGGLWTRSGGLSQADPGEVLGQQLTAHGWAVVNAFSVREGQLGLIGLGAKRRGVYNLADLEILSRIIQQTRLTLGVLYLLEREKLLLEKNYEANLTALRSQINPHFLFNTLNTISALIHDAPDQAEAAVEKLAFIFRYTLKYSSQTFVSLRDEISLVRTYLEIEKIRFGKRLNLEFELDPAAMEVQIPAFVIQTLVENCIKHGIARITANGIVRIAIRHTAGETLCEVYDNGPGIDLSRVRASTGLSNVLTRMHEIYGRDDLLQFENTGSGTRVTVCIPAGR